MVGPCDGSEAEYVLWGEAAWLAEHPVEAKQPEASIYSEKPAKPRQEMTIHY